MIEYKFYVYAYINQDNIPYYIGKGCGKRYYSSRHCVPVPPDKSRIIFLETNLSDIGACALERRYIKWYGRTDLGTGILHNKTEGGEGTFGYKHTNETKEKLRKLNTGQTRSEKQKENIKNGMHDINGENNPMFGKQHTNETKEKIRQSRVNSIGKLRGKYKKSDKPRKQRCSPSEETLAKMKKPRPHTKGIVGPKRKSI